MKSSTWLNTIKFESCCLPIFSHGSGRSVGTAGVFPPVGLLGYYPVSILEMCCHGNVALATSFRNSLLASSPVVEKGQRVSCCVVKGETQGVWIQRSHPASPGLVLGLSEPQFPNQYNGGVGINCPTNFVGVVWLKQETNRRRENAL